MKSRMKRFVVLSLLVFFSIKAQALETMPTDAGWVSNHWCNSPACTEKPVRWRTSLSKAHSAINTTGLEGLYSSGSAAPSISNLNWLKAKYGKNHPLYLIDLRQETHLQVNGLPISIFYKQNAINWGKNLRDISTSELAWSKQLSSKTSLLLYQLALNKKGSKSLQAPVSLTIKEVGTEEQAAKRAGLNYFRIDVPDYHPPSPMQVDAFLSLFKTLPSNAWLHFHCAAGKGRTTTFMVMRDILANGSKLSLNDIVNRQARLGGINVLSTRSSHFPWKVRYRAARKEFVELFYQYVRSQSDVSENFATWMTKQKEGPYQSLLKTAAYQEKN